MGGITRSTAEGKIVWLTMVIVLLLGVSSCLVAQQQAVQCVDPPGGLITCEKGQLATCTVVNGKIQGRCQTPPAELTGKSELDAWVFTEVTKRPVKPADINKPEFQEMLKTGKWQTGNKVITFHLTGIGISGSNNKLGSISQQGQNNIAQQGDNNQATIGQVPRKLTPEQKTKLLEALTKAPPFDKANLYVTDVMSSAESAQYAEDFLSVFRAPGVDLGPPPSNISHALFSSPQPQGLRIIVHDPNDVVAVPFAQYLLDVIANAGVPVQGIANENACSPGKVKIVFGLQPN